MSRPGSQPEWAEALRLGEVRGLLPREVVDYALEEIAGRPGGDLTSALIAFWVDVPETELETLLHEVRYGPTQAQPETAAPGPRPPLTPPCRLGDFDLLERLGEGGMGRVFRARQRSLARDVALKVLSDSLAEDVEGRRRFLREARALAALNHPHVVTCYQAGELDGQLFIAMELATQGDAGDLAARAGGRLDERRALEVIRDAALGLTALEGAGLVHRDIKPTNLFLSGEGQVKLGDLGLARRSSREDRLTLTGVAVGTLPFMSPEQLDGAAVIDVRSDIYALGATLFALLVGRPPQTGQGPPRDLPSLRPGLSPSTLALVQRAMARDPGDRYGSAAELLRAAEQALNSEGAPTAPRGRRIAPRPAPAPAPSWKVGAAVLVGATLLGSVAGLLWWKTPGANPALAADTARDLRPADPTPADSDRPPREERTGAAEPGPRTPPPGRARPEAKTEPPVPKPRPSPTPGTWSAPLAFSVAPRNGTLSRDANGAYRSRPNPGRGWHRAGLSDGVRRPLPLRVRWTLRARASRDASGLAAWERGHGFREPAGFFYELALRASNRTVDAARDLGPGAWFVSVQVRASGRVLGLVRVVNRDKPSGADLIAVPGPGQRATRGVAILGRFAFQGRPGAATELTLATDRQGWRLTVEHGGRREADLAKSWSDAAAPLRDELAGGVYLWAQLGNWSSGAGRGTLLTRVAR